MRTWIAAALLKKGPKSRAQIDDRLLRDIGLDRARASYEAGKSFWA